MSCDVKPGLILGALKPTGHVSRVYLFICLLIGCGLLFLGIGPSALLSKLYTNRDSASKCKWNIYF